jgi:hypothetical protein
MSSARNKNVFDGLSVWWPVYKRAVVLFTPQSPAEISLRAFLDASSAMEDAAPQTMAGWFAKWRQIVEHETEFDAGDASFNLKMMRLMLAEYAVLVPVEAIAVA